VTPLITGGDDRLPVFSPNGKLILFQRRTVLTGDYNLFTINVATHQLVQVTGRAGTATAGTNCDSDASWSPDGRWILDSACYGSLPACPGHSSITEDKIFLVSADGTQVIQVTRTPTEEDGAPAMSPDGRWIYFESHRTPCDDNSPSEIWRIGSPVRSDGARQIFRATQTSPISAPVPSAQNPCYLPNSSQLLFTVFTDQYNGNSNSGSAGLFRIPAAGGSPRGVVFQSGQSAVNLPGTCYSAAAGRIAYASDVPTGFSNTDNIWTSAPGSLNDAEREVTCYRPPFHAQEPSWSPDGKTIVFELDNDNAPNATTIMTVSAANDCAHPVAPKRIYPCPGCAVTTDNHEPNWSPNGSQIVFQRETQPPNGPINLWVVEPDGSAPTPVTSDPNSDTDPSWSPDSSSIVYSTDTGAPTGVANLWIVAATQGGAKHRLTSECYYDGAPSWSPDGRWVSFETWSDFHVHNHEYPTAIWRIPANAKPAAPKC
jgi:TolB protein